MLRKIRKLAQLPDEASHFEFVALSITRLTVLKSLCQQHDVASRFVLFLALTLPLLVSGAIATALTGLSLGEIHHHARQRLHATETKPPEDIL